MSIDPFTRQISGYDFGTPTDRGPHPGVDYNLRYEEIGLPFAVKIEQEGQIDGGVGGNEVLARIVGTPYEVILAHLDKFRRKGGDVVPAGADIAESGQTGESSGPHLHLQVVDTRRSGSTWAERSVDPRAVLQEVKTMQSVGGGDPGSGTTAAPDPGCLFPIGVLGKFYNHCTGQIEDHPEIKGAVEQGTAAATSGVGDAIANAQKQLQQTLGEAVPKYAVALGLAAAIGLLAFGGVKRIAD